MAKSIFVFNDGTGQNLKSSKLSNVAKLFLSLPGEYISPSEADKYKVDADRKYHSIYIRGIGTEDLRRPDGSKDHGFWKSLWNKFTDSVETTSELVTGQTIKDRVERTLLSIEKIWEPGDQVFLFGFSRGAASVRIAASHLSTKMPDFKVDYMLIFDTVYSVLNEIQIRQDMPIKRFTDTIIGPQVLRCDHLLAGDEMRDMFIPTAVSVRPGVRQLLFAGSHSDVGGGNPSSALSDITLKFSLDELLRLGIYIDFEHLKIYPNSSAKIEWDRFNGTGQTHYPRDLQSLDFAIHKSVFERANAKQSVSIALAQLTTFKNLAEINAEFIGLESVKASFDYRFVPPSQPSQL